MACLFAATSSALVFHFPFFFSNLSSFTLALNSTSAAFDFHLFFLPSMAPDLYAASASLFCHFRFFLCMACLFAATSSALFFHFRLLMCIACFLFATSSFFFSNLSSFTLALNSTSAAFDFHFFFLPRTTPDLYAA